MGAVAHLILLVIFFTLAGHQLAHAFKLPPASKLLLILAVVAALAGIVLATRRGRRLAKTRLLPLGQQMLNVPGSGVSHFWVPGAALPPRWSLSHAPPWSGVDGGAGVALPFY